MNLKNALCPLIIVAMSGCAMQEGDFPSLAKRPYEDQGPIDSRDTVTPALIADLPPALQTAVNEALAMSNEAHGKFLNNLPGVERRVNAAKGSSVSGESWVVAQMDLAALEMIRSPSVTALADVDALYMQRLDNEFEGKQPGGALLIAKSRSQIEAQVKAQQDAIDAMKAKLR